MKFINLLKTTVFAVATSTTPLIHAAEVNWGYFQHGEDAVVLPAQWGDHFPDCTGFKQSPIDIQNTTEAIRGEFEFDYKPTALHVTNNGHTIEVEYEPGSSMSINGEEYRLLQFHFHTPSEHLVDGNHFPMEVHLVHSNTDGELAVIGVLIEEGKNNKTFNRIIKNAPKSEGVIEVKGKHINVTKLLPEETDEYFNYSGSLTTPPCSEGVRWFVMKDSIELSKKQIRKFEEIIHLNARPVQEINDRSIYENDD